jgi:hypothetical protein
MVDDRVDVGALELVGDLIGRQSVARLHLDPPPCDMRPGLS